MKPDEYRKLDALGMADLIRRKEVRPSELMACALDMVEKTRKSINAVSFHDPELGMTRASEPAPGIFRGVPLLVKDLLSYPGLRFAMGSRLFAGNIPETGSEYTRRIDGAGFVTFGKTACSEFGLLGSTETRLNGITRNPWNTAYSAGGSSGGSSAAVAAGIVPMAHASDGGGSIRYPASVCGLFGFKPSKGRCVPSMDQPNMWTDIASEHCITKTVRDSAAFLSVTERQGADAVFPPMGFCRKAENRSLSIGVYTRTLVGDAADPEVLAVLDDTVRLCEDLGHTVIPAELPGIGGGRDYSDGFFISAGFWLDDLVKAMAPILNREVGDADLEPFTLELIRWVREMPPEAREKAWADLVAAGARMLAFAGDYDVLLSPTVATAPRKLGFLSPELDRARLMERTEGYIGFTPIHNSPANGMCAMSVPLFTGKDGMPVGSHFAALPGRDSILLGLAYQLESAAPWSHRLLPGAIGCRYKNQNR